MTRPLRLEYPGAAYHVMSRGDRRSAIYRDDTDRRNFLDLLAKEVVQQQWRLYAYCLRGDHYHLLVETPDANLVAGMRRLNGVGRFADDPRIARRRYREFVHAGVTGTSPWHQVRGQIFLGSERFLRDMEAMAAERETRGVPRAYRFPSRPDAEKVLEIVAQSFGVERIAVQGRLHQPAFRAWVYLLRRAANLTLKQVAQRAAISPGRVSQIQSEIEAEGRSAEIEALLNGYKV